MKRNRLVMLIVLVAVLLFLIGRTAARASVTHPCYQARIQFLNYPSAPSTYARWRFYTGADKHPHVLASGEFSFQPYLGGGYVRFVSACLTRDPYKPGLKIGVDVAPLNVACLDCQIVVQVRRTS